MAKTNKIDKITKKLVGILEKHALPVERVILYGSYASGNQISYSDIAPLFHPALRAKAY